MTLKHDEQFKQASYTLHIVRLSVDAKKLRKAL
jgi:hypothetical protein